MKIKSNATSNELSSPFYLENEKFCSDFENYIASKNGKVKGEYNAWSYLIIGKIQTPNNWTLRYQKSTFTTSGNLLLSSKSQTLLVIAEWETEMTLTPNSEFEIRKKTSTDSLKKIMDKSLLDLNLFDEYVLEIKNDKPPIISKLTEILRDLFLSGEIYKIEYQNDKLKIEMRTEKHHFEIFDRLIAEL